MTLPALAEWGNTRLNLHQAAQVIGAVRAAVAEPEPNWGHLGLRVVPDGLTTGVLPGVGEMLLDFKTLAVLYKPGSQDPVEFTLARYSQVTLADAVEQTLDALDHPVTLKRNKITGTSLWEIKADLAADYARVLFLFFETLRRFRESLPGEKSRLVVWPHGFDLSFLWFAADKTSEQGPHMAFGFSPGSAGLERPYVYTYAYPVPEGLTRLALPPRTRWHTAGWTGTITEYDRLVAEPDPATVIEGVLREIFDRVSPRLR